MRIIQKTMRHEIAAIRPITKKSVKTDARSRTRQEGQQGGKASKEFHVHRGIDPNSASAQNRPQRPTGERERTPRVDRDHIFFGNDFHRVEDEAVVLEDDEVDVLASDQFGRATNRGISQNGRALLREFDEENFAWLACGGRTRFDDFSKESQKETERDTDPSIGVLQSRDADRKIHCEERGYSLRLVSAAALFSNALWVPFIR